ncbi:DUF4862 family protein [Arthrobacter liuii]|uniref:DUF4862 domain-containing protein n=1 Tax=Arthrobacter liuii TaxID=1476996 RepID=A0ABQ2AXL8_9MICC|nr:DUF4862 family protein [Arthrobacter liuii]GGI01293.1 DUF4862 domain-containing protein [Arthrobacter liuii]
MGASTTEQQDVPAGYFIGAYAAAPSLTGWDPAAEAEFLGSVLQLNGVAGLELPFTDKLHKYDEDWLFRQLPADASFILTTIPGTMDQLAANPDFGLASTSSDGRQEALSFVRTVLQAAERLNTALGRDAVHAIQLHAAPVAAAGKASAAVLSESLEEVAEWEWNGIRLVLEHCDALMPGCTPAKGFLPLSDEAEAVRRTNNSSRRPIGMAINWGRSVIEQRRPEAGFEHLEVLRASGLLGGFTISGCSDVDTRYGKAWADVHIPPAPRCGTNGHDISSDNRILEESSLLTVKRLSECIRAAGPGEETGFRAIKVAAPPNCSVEMRVAAVAQTLDLAQSSSQAPANQPQG